MRLRKCPRCELNYIKEDEKLCNVCRREIKGEDDGDELQRLCAECGENPPMIGHDLCSYCIRERQRREKLDKLMERAPSETIVDIDVDGLDEIDMPANGEIPSEELQEIHRELGVGDGDDDAFEEDEDAFEDDFDEYGGFDGPDDEMEDA